MKIPDFLRPENIKPLDPDSEKMCNLIDEYKKVIGDDLSTEPFQFNTIEWIEILTNCIEKKITMWDYLGIEYDPEYY